jgi:hypothetical protein
MEVKHERTAWRDLSLSARHRLWGFDCPAVDIDFFVEYDRGVPAAIVEYKHERAAPQDPRHSTYRALGVLGVADDTGMFISLPFFAVRYTADFKTFFVVPINGSAKVLLDSRTTMDEEQWVRFLYHLRGREMPDHLAAQFRSGTLAIHSQMVDASEIN